MKDDQLSVSHPIVKGLAAIYLLILAFTIYSVTVPFLNSDLKTSAQKRVTSGIEPGRFKNHIFSRFFHDFRSKMMDFRAF